MVQLEFRENTKMLTVLSDNITKLIILLNTWAGELVAFNVC